MTTRTDVCLILEGTYPYVTGGVAEWVHQLIAGLPETTFSLAVILPNEDPERERKYDLLENVKEIQHIYLHDFDLPKSHVGSPPADAWRKAADFHKCPMSSEKMATFESIYRTFFDSATRSISPADILNTESAWQILKDLYTEKAADESFIDYFWTCRFMHLPIFRILTVALPQASLYHSLSTGYAGLLGVVGKLKYNRPLLLTEHGIYTRERRLEISRVDWIHEKDDNLLKVRHSQSRFKDLWNQMFGTLSRLCYEHSDGIITLFRGNQLHQIEEGAPRGRVAIIPNAINVDEFRNLAQPQPKESGQLVIGMMARVVHIKDIKTFIRACKSVAASVRNLKVYIMGPTDEEPDYYQECKSLSDFLGLGPVIEFTGNVDVKEYYPRLTVLALTSVSEAQPLVILEASSLGIPVVATDVGACREMLHGGGKEDVGLGKSGIIAGITNSDEIAQAILKIWRSKDLRDEMGAVGKQRVARHYNRPDLLSKYKRLYDHFAAADNNLTEGVAKQWLESALS